MIISKTPFRISFAGGGSDLSSYYRKFGGAVLSTTIDKYTYLSMHPYFAEQRILLKYSQQELVDTINEIKHPLIREVFRIFDINGVDFSSSADIPAGTGMASSSAFTAGLINLCAAYKGKFMGRQEIAEMACKVEIDILNEPIGKQDQFACSMGGFNLIEFNMDDTVAIERINIQANKKVELKNNLLLFYLGKTRSAASVLAEQKINLSEGKKIDNLKQMVGLVYDLKKSLIEGDIDAMGAILHEGWVLKQQLASGISNGFINDYYEKAINAGAAGGKLLGAGGGGFLLFYVKPEQQELVRHALNDLMCIDFDFETTGTSIIFN